MKHVDKQRLNDMLFVDINPRINNAHNVNEGKKFNGNIRLNLGLYKTPEETERYISESLKRKLP